jgi:acetyl-CoA acetyltransferase
MLAIRNKTAIVGTAYSRIARRADVTIGVLAVEAIQGALEDAGLTVSDVDGLAVYPDAARLGAGSVDGVDVVGAFYVARMLGLKDQLRWSVQMNPSSFAATVIAAANAVAAGACNHAVVWRAMHNPVGKFGRFTSDVAEGTREFSAPYGLANNVMSDAMPYSRYMSLYGATREHMATFIVNNRLNASANPDSVFYGKPLTKDDYMSCRMIAEPLSLLDCDMPVDGCGAVVVTGADRAKHLKQLAAYITGYASNGAEFATSPVITLDSQEQSAGLLGKTLWESCGMRPTDVDMASLYDGFSSLTYIWLEGLGFCKRGEAFEFIQDGRISIDGQLPLNTSGGSLGMGRLHGTPQVIEAVRQLQGRCGPRQVKSAKIVLAQTGPHSRGAAMILCSDQNI